MMEKLSYISPAITIVHIPPQIAMMAGSEEKIIPIEVESDDGEYDGEFRSKPHSHNLWEEEKGDW